jgi:O-antigen biosynthesis protein
MAKQEQMQMTEAENVIAVKLKVTTKDWQQQKSSAFRIQLGAITEQPSGWYRVVLTTQNPAARQMLQQQSILLHQNHNPHGVNLLAESANTSSLVFYRHNPLKKIILHWPQFTEQDDIALFAVSVRRISRARAWYHMLSFVSRRHQASGQSRSYIYRISRARSKRAGIDVALSKLVNEYQPLLAHQTISCEPYSYWRQTKEPALIAADKANATDSTTPFCLIVRAKGDSNELLKTLHSIIGQPYTHWTVHICKQGRSPSTKIKALLAIDPRIRMLAANSRFIPEHNSFCMLLQEGDCLAPSALTCFATAINQHSAAQVIYTDHDMLGSDMIRVAPNFKPAWNPDLFLSQNYIGPAYVVCAYLLQSCLEQPNWWLQHHYLVLLQAMLQLTPASRNNQIIHLPKVMLHQAQKNLRQLYTAEVADAAALYIARLAAQSGASLLHVKQMPGKNLFKVTYTIPRPMPMVSILIPTRDALEITRNCVNSVLEKTQYQNFEIIILDNQSEQPETQAWFSDISQHAKIRVLRYDHPFNYSAINNFGAAAAGGALLCLLNNDTQVINAQWLGEMVQHAIRPEIGCVGAKLFYPDDTIQHAGVVLGLWGLAGHAHKNYDKNSRGYQHRLLSVQNMTAVTAACLVIRTDLYFQVGGLEEQHLTVAFNDVDLCLKVQQAGYRNLWTPYAELYHFESKTRGKEDTPEKKAREQAEIAYMQQKWPQIITNDPCYSPNLTRSREDFSIGIE